MQIGAAFRQLKRPNLTPLIESDKRGYDQFNISTFCRRFSGTCHTVLAIDNPSNIFSSRNHEG